MINIESNYRFSQSILDKIDAVNAEDPAYAADELVELAEEILQQIAAVGMIQYLKHAPQKEVYNDFLIGLFNSSGHDYELMLNTRIYCQNDIVIMSKLIRKNA